MFKHRVIFYSIAACVVVLILVGYTGYKEYQKQKDFDNFMLNVRGPQDPIDEKVEYPKIERVDQNDRPSSGSPNSTSASPPVKVRTFSPEQRVGEWTKTDKSKSPIVVTPEEMVKQRVQTPDGKIHTIYVAPGREVKEGAILPEAFLHRPPPLNRAELNKGGRILKSDIPEGEDVGTYIHKTVLARAYGVPIEEVERMIESGTIQLPKVIAKSVDEFPVDEFMDHDHPLQSRGEVKHLEKTPRGAGNTGSSGSISNDFQSKTPTLPRPNSVSSSETVFDAPKMPAPPTVSYERLSPERFNNAQQLIDQYGTEEGLRRLRESDPEAARQFEQGRRGEPSRDVPDGEQSESGSKD